MRTVHLDYFKLNDTERQHLDALVVGAGLDRLNVRPQVAITRSDDGEYTLHVTEYLLNSAGKVFIADVAANLVASRPVRVPLTDADAAHFVQTAAEVAP